MKKCAHNAITVGNRKLDGIFAKYVRLFTPRCLVQRTENNLTEFIKRIPLPNRLLLDVIQNAGIQISLNVVHRQSD